MRFPTRTGAACAFLIALSGLALTAGAFVEGPFPAMTGGFGEPSCHFCHFDNPIDDPAGRLVVSGPPASYVPGERYAIKITLKRPGMSRGGFQMAARFADGEEAGRQAGQLGPADEGVQIVHEDDKPIEYAQHTAPSTLARAEGELEWVVRWRAPANPLGPVVFHIAANAANNDASPLGDFIYLAEAHSQPPTK
jgi:hypothetical protein